MTMFYTLALAWLALPLPSHAAATEWQKTKEVSTRLIAGAYNATLTAGMQFSLAEGWKTYWRTPGDAGLPLSVDFEGSDNLAEGKILWPVPKRIVEYEMIQSFAYKDEIVIPLRITPEDPQKPVHIRATAKYAVCAEICIFLNQNFSLDVAPGHTDKETAALIAKHLAHVPGKNGDYGLSVREARLAENNVLEVTAHSDQGFAKPDMLVEAGPDFRFPAGEISFSGDWKQTTFRIPYEIKLVGESLAGKTVTLTLTDGGKSVEYTLTLPNAVAAPADVKKNSRQTITGAGLLSS